MEMIDPTKVCRSKTVIALSEDDDTHTHNENNNPNIKASPAIKFSIAIFTIIKMNKKKMENEMIEIRDYEA